MAIICVYLNATLRLNSPHHQLVERLRIEHGLKNVGSSLGPHVTVKAPIEIGTMKLSDVHARLQRFVQDAKLKPVTAQVLPADEFPIEGREDTVLHLPFKAKELTALIEDVLDFFENEMHLARSELEGRSPYLTLVKALKPEDRESVTSIASSIRWPPEVTLDHLVIAHRQHYPVERWSTYRRIPL